MAMPSENKGGPLLERLRERLAGRSRRVLIIPHDYPDPDALSAAAAMDLLLTRALGLRPQIAFSGEVSRAENRELLRLTRYRWRATADLVPERRKTPCILIDTALWNGNVTLPDFVEPVAVVDHHPSTPAQRRVGEGLVLHIQPEVGATATLMFEELAAAGLVDTMPKWLATIMLYAIATETLDFSREVTDRDIAAYTALISRANLTALGRVRHAPLPKEYFLRLEEATNNASVYGRIAWTHLEDGGMPEIAAELADLLLRMERISWAFCTAVIGDRLVVSIRSCQKGARSGRVLAKAIGRRGSAGGHYSLAAGYVRLAGMGPEERRAERERLVRALIVRIERRQGLKAEGLDLEAMRIARKNNT